MSISRRQRCIALSIVAVAAAGSATAQPSAKTSGAVLSAPCCAVVGSNARTGVFLARNNSTGKTFLFTLKDKTAFTSLRIGTPVSFSRASGLSVQGQLAGFARIILPPKTGGGGTSVDIDCSVAAGVCPGGKSTGKLTMDGATTWDDVIDYCYDEIANCVSP